MFENLSVLVLDDDVYARRIIRGFLLQLGVRRIIESADGSDGLHRLTHGRPDLILCDVHMEPTDGIKFLGLLRAHEDPVLRNTPLIFLTADAKVTTVQQAKTLNAQGYLVKPISLSAMTARVKAALGWQ